MLDHVSITVSDFAAAERFYDAVMMALGVVKVGRSDAGSATANALTRVSGPRLSRHPQGDEVGR